MTAAMTQVPVPTASSLTPLGFYDKFNYQAKTTFIISAGGAGQIGYSEKPFWAADDCICIECADIILHIAAHAVVMEIYPFIPDSHKYRVLHPFSRL